MLLRCSAVALVALTIGCASTNPKPVEHLVRVVPVRCVAADALAAELVKQAGLRGGDAIGVTVDPRTNSLLLVCPAGHPDELPALLKRIGELDDRSRSTWTDVGTICISHRPLYTQVVSLRFAPAGEIARTLGDMEEASRRAVEQRGCSPLMPGMGGGAPEIPMGWTSVVADPESNSVTVCAGEWTDLARLIELIARLDEDAGRPR